MGKFQESEFGLEKFFQNYYNIRVMFDELNSNRKRGKTVKLTKAPKIDVEYGSLQNEKEWVNWIAENISAINKNATTNEIRSIASQFFKEISYCGWKEGYDSAKEDE